MKPQNKKWTIEVIVFGIVVRAIIEKVYNRLRDNYPIDEETLSLHRHNVIFNVILRFFEESKEKKSKLIPKEIVNLIVDYTASNKDRYEILSEKQHSAREKDKETIKKLMYPKATIITIEEKKTKTFSQHLHDFKDNRKAHREQCKSCKEDYNNVVIKHKKHCQGCSDCWFICNGHKKLRKSHNQISSEDRQSLNNCLMCTRQ